MCPIRPLWYNRRRSRGGGSASKTHKEPKMRVTRKPATKPATAPADEVTPQQPIPTPVASRKCLCRCGADITSKSGLFRPGHDAKAVGKLRDAVAAGEMTKDEALATLEPAKDGIKVKTARAIDRKLAELAKATATATAETEPVDGTSKDVHTGSEGDAK